MNKIPNQRYTCPKCGQKGCVDTVTRRNKEGVIIRKESYCKHYDPILKTKSGNPKCYRHLIGTVSTLESLGVDFTIE